MAYLMLLDVAVFKSINSFYDSEVTTWLHNHPGRTVTEKDFTSIFTKAYGCGAIIASATNGFCKAGIHPFNPNVFSDEDFTASNVGDRPIAPITILPGPLVTLPNLLVANDQHDSTVADSEPNLSIAKEEPNLSVANDQRNSSIVNDEPNQSVANDQPNLSVINDEPNQSVANDQRNSSIANDQRNHSVAKDQPTTFANLSTVINHHYASKRS